MAEEDKAKRPDPERLSVLKGLPRELVSRLTTEEVRAFLHDDIWPDSLKEKLKDYIVVEGEN